MGEEFPLISIITPSYNQGKFIEETIKSVMNQDYTNIEHIIIDGGSSDNTFSIIKNYIDKYNLQWISESDMGQSDALNKGFKLAKGEIIGWINSDDAYFTTHVLTDVMNFFKKYIECDIIYGDMIYIDEKNTFKMIRPAFPFFSYSILKRFNIVLQPSTFFKHHIIENYQLDVNLNYAMDYDFWLRIAQDNKFYHMPEILSCFRYHSSSKSITESKIMLTEAIKVAERYKYEHLSEQGNIYYELIQLLILLLPALRIHEVIKLYRQSDFAFDIKIPPMHKALIDNLLISNIFNRIFVRV